MNKKFVFLLTLTLGMMMSSCAYAFSDTNGHWAEEIIENAKNINIIKGYNEDLFMPDGYMTRAELATVIDRLFVIETETDKFIPDITRQDWYYSDIKKVMTMGIMQGDEKGNMNPNRFVTREEAILIISRAFNVKNSNESYYNSYLDYDDVSEWAKPEFLTFIRKGYINGYLDNTIRPKDNITRAEILTILDRLADINTKTSIYSTNLSETTLIRDTNVQMTNVEVYGDLIIGEMAAHIIKLNNVIINGNLILYAPLDETTNIYTVKGEIVKLYENMINSELYYNNEEYGIRFSIPDGSTVYNAGVDKIDYSVNDLIVVDVLQNDEYYFRDIEDIALEEIEHQNYDSIFRKKENGKVAGVYPYLLYTDKVTSNLLFVKRDNVVYKLLFMNVVNKNAVDSIIANIEFLSGSKISNHEYIEYNNPKLCLKFLYRQGYIGVDDSYNTGMVYSGDSFFKLFIQVNKITDIGDYSLKYIKLILKSLVQNDGTLIREEEKKIATHDAFQFEIETENDRIISLYVIIGNNLYNFIFKGAKGEVDAIGKEMFLEIVNSMEF